MKFLVKIREEFNNLSKLHKNLQNQKIASILSGIGVYLVGSVRKNFEVSGRPQKWKTLKKESQKRKRGNLILVDSGLLSAGITSETALTERAVFIGPSGPSTKYAGRHNFGDEGNSPIPCRQYLMMQTEDTEYINDFIGVSMQN